MEIQCTKCGHIFNDDLINDGLCEDCNDEPFYESEDCEYCLEEAEESGIEYEHNFTWENGTWVCDNCGRPQ